MRIYRRICVLRVNGQAEQAEHVRAGELSHALAAARNAGDPSSALPDDLPQLFAAEEERVANASVLAELVAPLLAEQLRGAGFGAAAPAASGRARTAPVESIESLAPSPPAPPPSPLSVADFIDGMLAQERARPRPVRRAS